MAEPKKTYSRADLESIAHQIAVRKGVDPALVKAVIDQESNWDPNARSHVGATGLMQLMPGTSREVGVKDPTDPVQNITGGVEYLKRQIQRFGDVGLALAAYNWGPGNAAKLQYDPRSVRIPDETQKYVPGVLGRMSKFGDQVIPSATTTALFPKVADAVMNAVRGKVGVRAGAAASPEDVVREIKTLTARAPAPPVSGPAMDALPTDAQNLMPVSAPGGGGIPTGPGGGAPPMISAEASPPEAQQNPLALLTSTAAARTQTRNIDQFLRARYGPLADVADPFPKAFDADLERLIDRA